jgi:hypothetical protein
MSFPSTAICFCQRVCKPLVGGSIPSPGTNEIKHFCQISVPNPCCAMSQTFPLRFNGFTVTNGKSARQERDKRDHHGRRREHLRGRR